MACFQPLRLTGSGMCDGMERALREDQRIKGEGLEIHVGLRREFETGEGGGGCVVGTAGNTPKLWPWLLCLPYTTGQWHLQKEQYQGKYVLLSGGRERQAKSDRLKKSRNLNTGTS